MQRLIGIKKINELKLSFKRPLIKSCIGEMLPDFRTRNKAGFDVNSNWDIYKEIAIFLCY